MDWMPCKGTKKTFNTIQWPVASEDLLRSVIGIPFKETSLGKIEGVESLKIGGKPELTSFKVFFAFSVDLFELEKRLAEIIARVRTLSSESRVLHFRNLGRKVSKKKTVSYFFTSQNVFTEASSTDIHGLASKNFLLLKVVEYIELYPALENQVYIQLVINRISKPKLSSEKISDFLTSILSQPVTHLNRDDGVIVAKYKKTTALEDKHRAHVPNENCVVVRLQNQAEVIVEPVNSKATARYERQKANFICILRNADANLMRALRLVEYVLLDKINITNYSELKYNLSLNFALFFTRLTEQLDTLLVGFQLTLIAPFIFSRASNLYFLYTIMILAFYGVLIVPAIAGTPVTFISVVSIKFRALC